MKFAADQPFADPEAAALGLPALIFPEEN